MRTERGVITKCDSKTASWWSTKCDIFDGLSTLDVNPSGVCVYRALVWQSQPESDRISSTLS